MKKILITVAVLLCGMVAFQSQAANSKGKTKRTKSLTGCLRQGDSANEYTIAGRDGSTWDVESESVSLAPHVGHTVTLTGAISHEKLHAMKEKTKTEMKEHGMKKSDREHGHLLVTNLTMVSDSCKN